MFCVSAGQSSSTAKLKSLTGAIEIMTETQHAFQLIHKELQEEQAGVRLRTTDGENVLYAHTVTYIVFSCHFLSCS